MEEKKFILTKQGLEDLKKELDDLILNVRKDVAEEIAEARAQGDLSENAEYDAARERQAKVEARIKELQYMVDNAEIIEKHNCHGKVDLGCKVTIHDSDIDETVEYEIVGSTEADPLNGKISNESPIGEALLGKKVGSKFKVSTPNGEVEIEVKKVKNN